MEKVGLKWSGYWTHRLALGVELHGFDDFVREKLLPHLGL
jgi:hypothetical protein